MLFRLWILSSFTFFNIQQIFQEYHFIEKVMCSITYLYSYDVNRICVLYERGTNNVGAVTIHILAVILMILHIMHIWMGTGIHMCLCACIHACVHMRVHTHTHSFLFWFYICFRMTLWRPFISLSVTWCQRLNKQVVRYSQNLV